PVVLLAKVWPGRPGDAVGAPEVDRHDRVPEFGCHLGEALVPDDPGVVHDNVDATEGVESRLHDGGGAIVGADGVGVRDGFAAGGDDFVDHLLGWSSRSAVPVHRSAEVVDDDFGAAGREEQRVLAAEAAAGAGDHGDSAFEGDGGHQVPSRLQVGAVKAGAG